VSEKQKESVLFFRFKGTNKWVEGKWKAKITVNRYWAFADNA